MVTRIGDSAETVTGPMLALSSSNARRFPTSPVIPKTARNLAIGLALGVLLGIGLAVLRDRLDNTVKDRADS